MNNFQKAMQDESSPWPQSTSYFCVSVKARPCAFTYNFIEGQEGPKTVIPLFLTALEASTHIRNIAHVPDFDGVRVDRYAMRTDIRAVSEYARENAFDGIVFCEDGEFGGMTKV